MVMEQRPFNTEEMISPVGSGSSSPGRGPGRSGSGSGSRSMTQTKVMAGFSPSIGNKLKTEADMGSGEKRSRKMYPGLKDESGTRRHMPTSLSGSVRSMREVSSATLVQSPVGRALSPSISLASGDESKVTPSISAASTTRTYPDTRAYPPRTPPLFTSTPLHLRLNSAPSRQEPSPHPPPYRQPPARPSCTEDREEKKTPGSTPCLSPCSEAGATSDELAPTPWGSEGENQRRPGEVVAMSTPFHGDRGLGLSGTGAPGEWTEAGLTPRNQQGRRGSVSLLTMMLQDQKKREVESRSASGAGVGASAMETMSGSSREGSIRRSVDEEAVQSATWTPEGHTPKPILLGPTVATAEQPNPVVTPSTSPKRPARGSSILRNPSERLLPHNETHVAAEPDRPVSPRPVAEAVADQLAGGAAPRRSCLTFAVVPPCAEVAGGLQRKVSDGKTTAVVFKTGSGPGERREPGGARKVMADQMIMEDDDEDDDKDEEAAGNGDDDDQDEDRDFDDEEDDEDDEEDGEEDQDDEAESRSVRILSSPRPSGDSRNGSIGSDQAHRRAEMAGRIDEEDEFDQTPSLDAHRDVRRSHLDEAGGSLTDSDQGEDEEDEEEDEVGEEEEEDDDGDENESDDEGDDDEVENDANINGTASGYEEDSEAGTSSEDDIDFTKRQTGFRAGTLNMLGRSPRPSKFRGSQGRLEKMQDDDEDVKETKFTSPRGRRGMYQVRRGKLVMQERDADHASPYEDTTTPRRSSQLEVEVEDSTSGHRYAFARPTNYRRRRPISEVTEEIVGGSASSLISPGSFIRIDESEAQVERGRGAVQIQHPAPTRTYHNPRSGNESCTRHRSPPPRARSDVTVLGRSHSERIGYATVPPAGLSPSAGRLDIKRGQMGIDRKRRTKKGEMRKTDVLALGGKGSRRTKAQRIIGDDLGTTSTANMTTDNELARHPGPSALSKLSALRGWRSDDAVFAVPTVKRANPALQVATLPHRARSGILHGVSERSHRATPTTSSSRNESACESDQPGFGGGYRSASERVVNGMVGVLRRASETVQPLLRGDSYVKTPLSPSISAGGPGQNTVFGLESASASRPCAVAIDMTPATGIKADPARFTAPANQILHQTLNSRASSPWSPLLDEVHPSQSYIGAGYPFDCARSASGDVSRRSSCQSEVRVTSRPIQCPMRKQTTGKV